MGAGYCAGTGDTTLEKTGPLPQGADSPVRLWMSNQVIINIMLHLTTIILCGNIQILELVLNGPVNVSQKK